MQTKSQQAKARADIAAKITTTLPTKDRYEGLSKELREELQALLQLDIEQVKARTPEQHKAAFRVMERALTSGGKGVAETGEAAAFAQADANKDKLLNLKEYVGYVEKESAAKTVRREPGIERTKEQNEAMYAALNKITPGTDGVSL